VLNALRVATVEMTIEKAAPYGVVNSIVTILRQDPRSAPLAGMCNAVLRRIGENKELVLEAPVQQMPQWLRQPVVRTWGREAVRIIEELHSMPPPLDITAKPGVVPQIDGLTTLPTGSYRLHSTPQVSTLPGFEAGDWWVQDAAAAMAVRLLAPQAGERMLDLCAAPGGKTLQAASMGADVTALDISGPRLERLRENLKRTGLNATIVSADALHWKPEGKFDAILLDAPCSATGTIRRHPDLPFIKEPEDVEGLIKLQAKLLDRALGWLAPGGRLVFATCSLLPDEGEAQIRAALARHPNLVVDRADRHGIRPEGVELDWISPEGGLRLRPDLLAAEGGMDGFYMARLSFKS